MLVMVLHVVDFDLFEVAAFSRVADVVLCVMSKVVKLVGYHESQKKWISSMWCEKLHSWSVEQEVEDGVANQWREYEPVAVTGEAVVDSMYHKDKGVAIFV